ncbi:hypothetical protein KOW79_017775 [Hemibagrus wyckioides]|uniref:Uncharacterized protein n=1 Tax=Hemibagrus wyckioides TaxID=337641 RepID=A0A9D3N9K5_9TELE|nr:hypothetical protein KOW79_017775 [Hemibagrus wyckioides]
MIRTLQRRRRSYELDRREEGDDVHLRSRSVRARDAGHQECLRLRDISSCRCHITSSLLTGDQLIQCGGNRSGIRRCEASPPALQEVSRDPAAERNLAHNHEKLHQAGGAEQQGLVG